MMLARPKSDILQAIIVSYGNREEVKEFLGENFIDMKITNDGEVVAVFWMKLFNEIDDQAHYTVATTGDVIVKFATGEFLAMRTCVFDALFDYHFVPDKPPETWENSNDREIQKKTGQS